MVFLDSYDINDMDYHWDDENAVIILDDEMSEFELANAQSERKLVKYVIGMPLRNLFPHSPFPMDSHSFNQTSDSKTLITNSK